MNEIVCNGKKYIRVDDVSKDFRIIILQRGWVMVGRFERNDSDCTLYDASVIRRWGTTKGLGELTDGPLGDTKIDKCNGVVQFDSITMVASVKVSDKWEKYL